MLSARRAGGPVPQTLAYRLSILYLNAGDSGRAKSVALHLHRTYLRSAPSPRRAEAASVRATAAPYPLRLILKTTTANVLIHCLSFACRWRENDGVVEVWKQPQKERPINQLSDANF